MTLWDYVENPFDEVSRTDTGGVISLADLDIQSPNLPFGTWYQGVKPPMFADAMEFAPRDRKEWTFVDLGCGKGRALLLAAQAGFRECIGVEFAPALAAIAKENVARANRPPEQDCPISVIDGDAADYRFSSDKIFLLLANPFHSPVMDRVIANLMSACDQQGAEAFVLYIAQVCHGLFVEKNFEVITYNEKFSCYRYPGRPSPQT